MIKVLSAQQIRDLDAFTIKNEPVSSIDLMERACRVFVDWFVQRFDQSNKIGVVCGTGNNGGDGLGIARLLKEWGYPVKVWIVRGSVKESPDFQINLERLQGKIEIFEILSESDQDLFEGCDILIDAIFGSGLTRPTAGIYAQAIRCINNTHARVVAVDIPSGLQADEHSEGDIVKADFTVSFQLPKLAFFFPQSNQFTGEWSLLPIGLSKAFLRDTQTTYRFLTLGGVQKLIRKRDRFDHKGKFGHALLVAGSFGKMGAAVLASKAVLRAGAGLLTVHVPKVGYQIIQTSVPEAMATTDKQDHIFSSIDDLEKYSTIGIGPGLGQHELTAEGLKKIFENFRRPIVLDADALNIISNDKELQNLTPENSILTPHPKEFERLVGTSANDFDRLARQKELSQKRKVTVVLKGAFTSISTPDGDVYFNSTGNPGMATGGTGDVLTGVLTGLLAQNYSPEQAAIIGVFLHGLAGDLVRTEKGEAGMIASDLIDFMPHAWLKVTGTK